MMAPMDATGRRRVLAAGLIVLACLLAVSAHVSLWLDRVVLDTAGFVRTLEPLSDDDRVTDALAASTTEAIDAGVRAALGDTDGSGGSPVVGGPLAEDMGAVVRGWVEEGLRAAYASDAFDTVWSDGLRQAHQDFLAAVDDPDAAFTVRVTDVLVDLDADLSARGVDVLDDEAVEEFGQVEVLDADQLGPARRLVSVVDTLGPTFPWVALLAAVAALAVAPDRRRTLMVGGVAVAASVGLATGLQRWLAGREVGRAEPADRPVAEAAWDALVAPLDRQALLIGGAALALAAGTWAVNRWAGRPARSAQAPVGAGQHAARG
jgi:hypothetical protein